MVYHKIQGLYKRYREGANKGKFIIGDYSLPEFKLLKDIEWEFTEKVDGTNIRFNWISSIEELELKGKTEKSDMPIQLKEKFDLLNLKDPIAEIFGSGEEGADVCLYLEGLGYKIQNGCKYFNGRKANDFVLFDVKIGEKKWLSRAEVNEIGSKLNLKTVPILGYGTVDEAITMVKNGFKSTWGDFIAEGLVIRPKEELFDKYGHRIITKIKYCDFGELK